MLEPGRPPRSRSEPPGEYPEPARPAPTSLPRASGLVLPFPKVRARRPAATAGEPAMIVGIGMGEIVRLLRTLDEVDRAIALAVRRKWIIPRCLDGRRPS
jgi:hypothetical protein